MPATPTGLKRNEIASRVLPWLGIAACWLLLTEYFGLEHDSLLYSFQAVARLHPELYAGDVYLRHGSQDVFSAFSSIYSFLVAWLGMEDAAAWASLVSLLLVQFTAWLLARRLVEAPLALLGLAMLIVLPKGYGPFGIFRVAEPFITPRMPAEVLAICALLAVLSGRRILAAALVVGSACLHPLIATPAALIVAWMALPERRRWWLPVAALAGFALFALVASLPLVDAYRIDPEWRDFFQGYAAYLFMANWRQSDWILLCPMLLTLIAAAQVLERPQARQLCWAAMFAAALGLLVMAVGADWLHIPFVVQGQGWRWMWPAKLLALMLLPAVVAPLWRMGTTGKAAVLALFAVWLSSRESFGPLITMAAAAAILLALKVDVNPIYRRWILMGCATMLAIALAFHVAERSMVSANPYTESFDIGFVAELRYFFDGGLAPAALLVGLFLLARQPRWAGLKLALAVGLTCACMVLVPAAHASWSRRAYGAELHASFAAWRAQIPVGSEVVWIEKPEFAWFLLERPSYFSAYQNMSGVFFREAVPDILSREAQLIPFMKADGIKSALQFIEGTRSTSIAPARSLAEVCDSIDTRFIVARSAFDEPPLSTAPAGLGPNFRAMKLYRCDPVTTSRTE